MVITEHHKYVVTSQAAKILGKSPGTVRAMIRRGELRAEKTGGMYILYRADVEALVQRG